jgi:GNAT superfamily N-acetyltransferase
MAASIRIATDTDRPTVAALRRRWNEENAGENIDDPRFDAAFGRWWDTEAATRTFFLAEQGTEPVGMANVKRYDRMPAAGFDDAGSWGYVGNVFVVPERRNAGIGEALMGEIVAWAGRRGLVHLRLAPSPRSVGFYERLGYVPGSVVELDPPG